MTQAITPANSGFSSIDPNNLGALDTADFLQILIAELSNQDPLEPMDNNQLLNQITSINSVESQRQLTETLSSLNQTQSLGSASNLIGRQVSGVGPRGLVTGVVNRAIVDNGQVVLQVGDSFLPLSSVIEVRASNP